MNVFKNGLDANQQVRDKYKGDKISFIPVCAFGIIYSVYRDINTESEMHIADLLYCDEHGKLKNGGGFYYHTTVKIINK